MRPDAEGVEFESPGARGMRYRRLGRYEPRDANDEDASSHSVNSSDGESDAADGEEEEEEGANTGVVVSTAATATEAAARVQEFVTGAGMAGYMNAMHNQLGRVRDFGTELSASACARSSILMIAATRNTWRVRRRNGANVRAVCMLCAATHSCAYDVMCGGGEEEQRQVGYAGIQCATRFEALCALTRLIADATACYRAPFASNTAVITALAERERQADALVVAADRAVHAARRKRR